MAKRPFKQLWHFFERLSNAGVTNDMEIEYAQRVKLTNILAAFPVLFYLFYVWFGIAQHFYFPIVMALVLLLSTFIAFALNFRRQYTAAKVIIFAVTSFSILVTYNILNIDLSMLSYYFPMLIAYEILFDIKKEFKVFVSSILFSSLCIAGCFLLPKHLFFEYVMTQHQFEKSVLMNYSFSLAITIAFIFAIMHIHAKTQDKLVNAREESEKANKAKSTFLSNMSHELRTPLNGIIGATNLLLHEPASQSQKKYYYVLQQTSAHMLHLINHILDFSKINEGKIQLDKNSFNLKMLVHTVGNVFKVQNSNGEIFFNVYVDESLNREVNSDDLRLKQIMYNLLSNAFKFTRKGSITLQAKLLEEKHGSMKVEFMIQDSGIGISLDKLKTIFESFEQADTSTTREFGGTGLGLSISKQLVELFNSSLQVESEIGKGTTFRFTIDVENAAQQANILQAETPELKSLSGLRVLVAEDNKINMMVLKTFLKKWDVQPTEAVNGLEAVEKYRKDNKQVDVVLMDLEMPEMDGYTALKEIRKHNQHIPIIAFTAALYDGMERDLKVKGFNDYLHKPFNPTDLYEKIERYKKTA